MESARLDDLLLNAPVGPLVHADGRWTSREEILEGARSLAAVLRDSGVSPGEPIGALLPNRASGIEMLFGIWAAGGVVVPLNPRMTPPECARVLDHVGVDVVVAEGGVRERFAPVLAARRLMELDGSWTLHGSTEGGGTTTLDPDSAFVLFTSGTTGEPKPVVLRHDAILSAIDAVLERLGARSPAAGGTRTPNIVPVAIYLWSGIYNVCFSLKVRAPLLLIDHFEPVQFARLVEQFGITSSVLAPAMLTMLLDDPSVTDLSPLRIVRSISAPLSPREAKRFHERFGVVVLNGYGQTELGGEVIGWSAKDSREFGERKLGSVGRPHPGVGVRILGDDGTEVAPGEVGELCVRSPFVMAGYLGGEADTDRWVDGHLRTGDLGFVDDDGFVWIEGRRSDMINRGGLKVQPAEVEEVLRTSPDVVDVAVAGVPDPRLGEVPVAFVVIRRSEESTVESDDTGVMASLRELARAELAPYKVPVDFVALDVLPRNDMGKILRRELTALVGGEQSA